MPPTRPDPPPRLALSMPWPSNPSPDRRQGHPMKAYQILAGSGIVGLEPIERSARTPDAQEIKVRIEATSLNPRDLSFARGQFYNPPSEPIIPLVDGCGEIIAIGESVTRFKVGDRVITSYYPRWIDGAPSLDKTAVSFGAQFDGTLAEEIV